MSATAGAGVLVGAPGVGVGGGPPKMCSVWTRKIPKSATNTTLMAVNGKARLTRRRGGGRGAASRAASVWLV